MHVARRERASCRECKLDFAPASDLIWASNAMTYGTGPVLVITPRVVYRLYHFLEGGESTRRRRAVLGANHFLNARRAAPPSSLIAKRGGVPHDKATSRLPCDFDGLDVLRFSLLPS
jgi:hypothetical protein